MGPRDMTRTEAIIRRVRSAASKTAIAPYFPLGLGGYGTRGANFFPEIRSTSVLSSPFLR
jgi:hypothetical protein